MPWSVKRIIYAVEAPLRDYIYSVEACRLLTPHVAQIFLRHPSPEPLQYEAGQYIKIVNPDQSTSPFSIANAPKDFSTIELHLLFLKDNRRAMDVFRRVKEDQQLVIRGPFGRCGVTCLAAQKPIIFLARGTGFAPIKAVIEALIQQPDYPPMHLYWSSPGWRDLYLRELIQAWMKTIRAFQFTAVLTREFLPSTQAKFGALPPIVLQDYPDLSHHQVYASGPEAMIYGALDDFQQHGLVKELFYSDVFDYAR